ncbi:tRNA1(Val) (adenine(37)-N6)-methyltransferase [Sneathiella limimaris]|uniref:tRNA1(Val) (adenine(37)-N6)-methyltransferase n=1 Tax=Sneathiella limimaris TaxID=1964213 RepID=UPI001469BCD4|nr:methyltransferase [Sneathiella limimaris]
MDLALTRDGFLDGKLQITQPESGFRAGSDAVLLAASVPAKPGDMVLDVGAGVGTAGLCLKYRVPDCVLFGIELQESLTKLAGQNAADNHLEKGTQFIAANITHRRDFNGQKVAGDKSLLEAGFDHVLTNPPFYEEGRAQVSTHAIKGPAHVEADADLATWIRFCVARLKPKGQISLIHRTERLTEILTFLGEKCGRIEVLPLLPSATRPAKRVLVRAEKGSGSPLKLLPGLVLHEEDGTPTETANEILRRGASIADLIK